MLVLTRKLQEQISIGQDITITILRVKGNTVRIGIDAPNEVRVVRGELPRHETPRIATSGYQAPAEYELIHERVPQHTTASGQSRTPGLKSIVDRIGQRNRGAASALRSVAILAD